MIILYTYENKHTQTQTHTRRRTTHHSISEPKIRGTGHPSQSRASMPTVSGTDTGCWSSTSSESSGEHTEITLWESGLLSGVRNCSSGETGCSHRSQNESYVITASIMASTQTGDSWSRAQHHTQNRHQQCGGQGAVKPITSPVDTFGNDRTIKIWTQTQTPTHTHTPTHTSTRRVITVVPRNTAPPRMLGVIWWHKTSTGIRASLCSNIFTQSPPPGHKPRGWQGNNLLPFF